MANEGGLVGQIHEVDRSFNSLEIEDLARFAVDEHNKKQNAMLQFKKLVDAKQQSVAGLMHHLTLEATDGDSKKVYKAKVWEKAWENFKQLEEFKHVEDAPSDA